MVELLEPRRPDWAACRDPVPLKHTQPGAVAHACNPSTLRRLRQWADHLSSGVRDQPGQHGETLSILKLQKLVGVVHTSSPSYSEGWGRRIA